MSLFTVMFVTNTITAVLLVCLGPVLIFFFILSVKNLKPFTFLFHLFCYFSALNTVVWVCSL